MLELGDEVQIIVSGERGTIAAEARYLRSKHKSYLVEYLAADGRATEAWFFEDQISARVLTDPESD